MTGLYIHIPFCASRCIYCGFYSTTSLSLRDQYVDALGEEMRIRGRNALSTIYIGGGTPSQLTHDQLVRLFTYIYNVYDVAEGIEVTMECNPDDIRPGMLEDLPVNRVSMGAQTFSDDRLRLLHRRHTADEVRRAVEILRRDGIANISIDLMFGFPGETLEDWEQDVEAALALKVEHVSAYSLMYEEGTVLYRMLQQGKVSEVDEELSNAMYYRLIDRLTAAGYEHYEISNFAKPGFRSRHNGSYWNDTPYVGIGAAAHSYDRLTRSWNVSDIREYIAAVGEGRRPFESETIDARTHYDDCICTALRTCEGIDLRQLSPADHDYLLENAAPYVRRGLLAVTDGHLHLTRAGILISNTIMSDLMRAD